MKSILLGVQITIIGGIISLNPSYNLLTLGYIIMFAGFLLSAISIIVNSLKNND